ncbi:MAG: hypothetical protein LBG84_05845 [Treponema sp.]|jgi:hypothetical protein|nr:hypothetical protein [Treponema sp.]
MKRSVITKTLVRSETMRRGLAVFQAVLLIAGLAVFVGCGGGTFIDPGHEAAPGLPGGPTVGDGGGGGIPGGEEGVGDKPRELSPGANDDDKLTKLAEIVQYIQTHPATAAANAQIAMTAMGYQADLQFGRAVSYSQINTLISRLR